MSQARLFGSRISPFVEKVARALALKSVPFELVPLASPRDFRAWNPQTGKMPVLELDGERIYDSTFILRRLDASTPEPPLFSSHTHRAAAQRQLEDWSDEALYWYVMAARWSERCAKATARQISDSLPALLRPIARRLLPRQIGGTARAQGLGRLPWDMLVSEFAKRLDDLVLLLGAQPFFYGDAVGAADLAIFGQLHTARSGPTPELTELISHRPALVEHLRRVADATGGTGA